MLIDDLNTVLDHAGEPGHQPPAIKRLIKSARRKFRPKAPTDVYRLTFLATLLYVVGNQKAAESILCFVDENTGEYTDGTQDLAVELAMSRVIWAHILRNCGQNEFSRELLSRPEIGASAVLANIAPPNLDILLERTPGFDNKNYRVGENLVRDILVNKKLGIEAEETCEDNTRGDKLRSCYHAFSNLIIIRERSEEIRDLISEDDDLQLDKGIKVYQDKIAKYL